MLPAPPYVDSNEYPAINDYSTTDKNLELEGGFCWKIVFTEPTPQDWRRWIGVDLMKTLSKTYKISEGYFTVEMVSPGLIHIEETEDETEWCVGDIFQLPTWYMVG